MDNTTILQYLVAAGGVLGGVIAWVTVDAGFKNKITALEEKVASLKLAMTSGDAIVNLIGTQNAQCEQERKEFYRSIEKLETSKASKEMVESFRQEMVQLRSELAGRFDRLERFMEYKMFSKKPEMDDPQS